MPGAKVNVKIPASLEERVRRDLQEIIKRDELLNDVGEIARKSVIQSILQAKEPATGQPFKERKLSDKWRKRKAALSGSNRPVDATAAGGSSLARLVFTGQWLESFKHRIIEQQGKKVVALGPTGTHQPYKNLDGTASGKPIKNETLGKYLLDQGRNWVGIPEKIKKIMINTVRAFIRRELTKRRN